VIPPFIFMDYAGGPDGYFGEYAITERDALLKRLEKANKILSECATLLEKAGTTATEYMDWIRASEEAAKKAHDFVLGNI
jgi:hypothetical protein